MVLKRARRMTGLLGALLLAGALGCATSATVSDDDDPPDGGSIDRSVQQDAPPFLQDTAPLPDGWERPDGFQDDAADPGDGPIAQQDAGGGDAGACTAEPTGGNTCADAIDRGSLSDLASSHLVISGQLWPAGDVDWYRITFVDSPDDGQACDKFNARIAFTPTGNPGGRYAFDVFLGDCATAPRCDGAGDSHLATTALKWDDSGECPCNADALNTLPGTKVCVDHSMVLTIRVFRVSGTPVCERYELALDNG